MEQLVGKGLFIYCTGTATINGTVNMSGVTCSAEGQDVFLWKNTDGSFEYIRKNGGNGGNAKSSGQGFGYNFSYTMENGMTTSMKDIHLISGGGGRLGFWRCFYVW